MLLAPQVHASLVLPIEILCSSRHPNRARTRGGFHRNNGDHSRLLEKPHRGRDNNTSTRHVRPLPHPPGSETHAPARKAPAPAKPAARAGSDDSKGSTPNLRVKSEEHTPIGGLRSWLLSIASDYMNQGEPLAYLPKSNPTATSSAERSRSILGFAPNSSMA
jgi:hypothetical protein